MMDSRKAFNGPVTMGLASGGWVRNPFVVRCLTGIYGSLLGIVSGVRDSAAGAPVGPGFDRW